MATEFPSNPNPRGRKDISDYANMRWGIPIGIAAVALIAGFMIFSAAGPDRTRTVNNNNQPSAVGTTPGPKTGARLPAETQVPSKSNPQGTQ
jgi:hypothetical protein